MYARACGILIVKFILIIIYIVIKEQSRMEHRKIKITIIESFCTTSRLRTNPKSACSNVIFDVAKKSSGRSE